MEVEKMKVIKEAWCTDCNRWEKQEYRGTLADGSQLFLCLECGCENTVEDSEEDSEQSNQCKYNINDCKNQAGRNIGLFLS